MTSIDMKADWLRLKDSLTMQLEIRLDAPRKLRQAQALADAAGEEAKRIREQMQEIERQLRPRAA